jgi:hypothetical protein
MNPKHQVTPLDKDALVLLPGLRYARSLIDIAIQVSRRNVLRQALEALPGNSKPEKSN